MMFQVRSLPCITNYNVFLCKMTFMYVYFAIFLLYVMYIKMVVIYTDI